MPKLKMEDSAPSGKVTFATVGATLAWIIVKVVSKVWPTFISPEEMMDWQGAFTILLVFGLGYAVRPSKGDVAEIRKPPATSIDVGHADVEVNP